MASRRRIVPDNSVMIAALFKEEIKLLGNSFDISRRAQAVRDAIFYNQVRAFAPEQLVAEFIKIAKRKASEDGVNPNLVHESVRMFIDALLSRHITLVSHQKLAERAWELTQRHQIPPPDSWYLACAQEVKAELWLASGTKDHLLDNAKEVHREVYALTDRKF